LTYWRTTSFAGSTAGFKLVAAFRQRDPEVAATAVLQHLSRNEQTALLALDPGPSPVTPVS